LLAIGILGLILITGPMGVAATLGVSVNLMTSFQSVCYPYVSREEALELKLDYRVEGPRVESSVIVDTQPHRKYVGKRRAWQREALRQIFGA